VDRRVAAAVAGMVVVALALVAWETFDDPGRGRHRGERAIALADGFRVAPGSRLVATVVRRPPDTQPGAELWSALLDVDGDALTVLNAYVGEARRLGYGQPSTAAGAACRWTGDGGARTATSTPDGSPPSGAVEDVNCTRTWVRGDRALDLQLRVCSTCATPIGAAWMTMRGRVPQEPGPAVEAGEVRGQSLRLTAEAHRRAWSTRGTHAPSGARPLSPEVSFDGCDGNTHTVFEVTGDPRRAFDAYLAAQRPEETGTEVRARIGGDNVTAWRSVNGIHATLVQSARLHRPVLAVDVCYSSPG
jgi:hypothetical protein